MSPFSVLLLAFLGGTLPALLWLWFWLREDDRCPEPRSLIVISFLAGMVAVAFVIPLERAVGYVTSGGLMVVLWAMIEEAMKFLAAYFVILRRKEVNEPVDAVIYMITVALGFAACENALFLFAPLSQDLFTQSLITGNLRFIGATLLHTLASATIGIALALTFYKTHKVRDLATAGALVLATLLHALFNFSIMSLSERTGGLLLVFLAIWVGTVAIIILFERIKQIPRPNTPVVTNP
jgi:RsiW-degrading membrane proteinase PrsW (M82 family)